MTLPEFATNRPDLVPPERMADAVATALGARLSPGAILRIATAYFNAGGFALVAEPLEAAGPVRLLLGAEPTDDQVRATITPLAVRGAVRGDLRLERALTQHDEALRQDRDLVGFGRNADVASERLIAWLRRGNVQVRRVERGFLHGKAWIVDGMGEMVLAGSSNLTYAGLARNHELNLGVYQPTPVAQVTEWFEEQWDAATDYDLAALYEERRVPHHPWHVFLRMLLALYPDALDERARLDDGLGLADFQVDGVWRATRILDRRGGVIVADEVGLGKTFVAGELIRRAVVERRQKVLIVAPATLRLATWEPFLRKYNLRADVVSFEGLVAGIDEAGHPGTHLQALDEYAMVVVDEAHNLRTATTQRAEAMRRLLAGPVPKDLVLLSATPVNNSLRDLHTLLSYINPSDTAFADVDVPSVRAYIESAMARDPNELTGRDLFEVLDAIAVRRTRRFIRQQYPNATVNGRPIVFPQAVVHRVDYRLDQVLPGFFPRFAAALGVGLDDADIGEGDILPRDPGAALTMARYVPSRYELGSTPEQYEVQNAGLLVSGLLKRFESSSSAFCTTLSTMIASHAHFLAALDRGWVLTGAALRAWIASDTDDVDALVADLDEDVADNSAPAANYDVAALREAVVSDRALLTALRDDVAQVHWRDDPKIAALVEELAVIAADARTAGLDEKDVRDRRKVLVFTYFADTATYLANALEVLIHEDPRLADYTDRLVLVTGRDRGARQDAVLGFAPRSAAPDVEIEDRYDLAVATDVLAEGVNLQQAGHIINYDLPWNPMRLVQRHGRIDRLGSPHSHIHMRCFFPDDDLEALLDLEARLQRKLAQAAAAFGADEVLPGMMATERVLAETREDIRRLQRQDPSFFDDPRNAATSSEELQRRLAVALRSSEALRRRVEHLPWGAGTGIARPGAVPAIVFCVLIADHDRPAFRYVPLERDTGGQWVPRRLEGEAEISAQALTALEEADPGDPSVPADLPRELHEAALDVWPMVQRHVYESWMERTDPATLERRVPRAMRQAAELVRRSGGFLGAAQDTLATRLGQDVEVRIQRDVRNALREHEGDAETGVRALRDLADAHRLTVPEAPRALPEIELEDVRVLAWTVVYPGEPTPVEVPPTSATEVARDS